MLRKFSRDVLLKCNVRFYLFNLMEELDHAVEQVNWVNNSAVLKYLTMK